jgi:ribosomal-protein-serine acetyltransferase
MHKMLVDLPTELETERLLLRPYQAGDGAAYFALCQNNREHLLPFEAGNPALAVQTTEDAEILVREFAASWVAREIFFMGVWEKESAALVAQVVVMVKSWDLPEFAVGYFVDKDQQGKGFVTEATQAAVGFAFENLGANRLSSGCNETNVRSRRVLERCGFVQEGHLRQTRPHINRADGVASGDLLFGMLREEYERLYKK